jgi:hypothetical protein
MGATSAGMGAAGLVSGDAALCARTGPAQRNTPSPATRMAVLNLPSKQRFTFRSPRNHFVSLPNSRQASFVEHRKEQNCHATPTPLAVGKDQNPNI